MHDHFQKYMPHGHCFLWQVDLLSLHVIADAVIALSYFSIPLAIFYYLREKKIKERRVPTLFIAFIISCGITHVFSIWNFWHGDYWIAGFFKAWCALISAFTAVFLWILMPKVLRFPTVQDVERLNEELITSNQNLELKVLRRTQQLEFANKELSHINSIISHDFRNSLGSLIGFSNIISTSDDFNEIKKFAEMVNQSAMQLNNFINDVTASVGMQYDNLVFANINLNSLILNVVGEFQLSLEEIKGQISIDTLPIINCVESLIHQLFVNLFSNSIKYRDPQRDLRIQVYAKESPVFHFIYWEDNGLGIDPKEKDEVFEMFTRGKRATQAKGSGIGLAFCRRICRIHGGDISLDIAKETPGSRFIIKISKLPTA